MSSPGAWRKEGLSLQIFPGSPGFSDKISTVDIVDIILRLVLRPRVVYQREIKG
jgi:hypothetical protein